MRRLVGWILCALLAVPNGALASIVITEIMYDAPGADTKNEWIEIQNTGTAAVDMSSWKFVDKSNHVLNAPPKNGGTGSLVIAPGAYAIIAAEAASFSVRYPGIETVIDTAMSLNNTGATVSLTGGSVASATYAKSLGASGTGESLQLHDGAWIHAKPTPGSVNATQSTATAPKTAAAGASKKAKPSVSIEPAVAEAVIETTAADAAVAKAPVAHTASAAQAVAGAWYWWALVAALAIGTAAVASYIVRMRRSEWDIVEETE